MALNNYNTQDPAVELKKLRERVTRLERRDNLTRVHPVTGAAMAGTVINTPSGVPIFVATDDGGLEAPGLAGVANHPEYSLDLSTLPGGMPNGSWVTGVTVGFAGVLTDAVEIEAKYSTVFSGLSTTSMRIRSYTINPSTGAETTVGTSGIYTSGSSLSHFTQGVWRWEHTVPLNIETLWAIEIQFRANSATNTLWNSFLPTYAAQRGADILPDTSGFTAQIELL